MPNISTTVSLNLLIELLYQSNMVYEDIFYKLPPMAETAKLLGLFLIVVNQGLIHCNCGLIPKFVMVPNAVPTAL